MGKHTRGLFRHAPPSQFVAKRTLEEFQFERRDIVATAQTMRRELSPSERKRLADLFRKKIEACLDAGKGACHLANPEVAQMTAQALTHFDGRRYHLYAWCVMPNHVHVVFRPFAGHALSRIVHTWKSYSAKQANLVLGRCGEFWQREYYDHLVRDQEDFRRVMRYVLENPRRAGLLDWPWAGVGSQD